MPTKIYHPNYPVLGDLISAKGTTLKAVFCGSLTETLNTDEVIILDESQDIEDLNTRRIFKPFEN